jgi:hypothetical protein
MSRTISFGSRGPEVTDLQRRLNALKGAPKPPLAEDGIFGPKTRDRVHAFQRSAKLVVDGIVGPKTWAALFAAAPLPVFPVVADPACDCCMMAGAGTPPQFLRHAKGVTSAPEPIPGKGGREKKPPSDAPPPEGEIGGVSFRRVSPSEESRLRPYYGSSIDYSRVFMTNQTGVNGRAFVLTVWQPGTSRDQAVIYVNIGTSYSDHTLIHEFGHVWQAQHHSNPLAYMGNALLCQGAAEARNLLPGSSGYSAYAYKPGLAFSSYGAEQMAQMVANGEADIIRHVRGIVMNTIDPDLLPDPKKICIEDQTAPGVSIY